MGKQTLASIIKENVRKLRESDSEIRGAKKFAKFCKVGEGTIWRIDQESGGTNVETLEKIASRFKLEGWQLLIPGFDPSNPPVLAKFTEAERKLYAAIEAVKKDPEDARHEKVPAAVGSSTGRHRVRRSP